MSRYVMARMLEGLVTLLAASIIIFGLARLTGNPVDVILPENSSEEDVIAMTKYLGLDKSLPEQYWIFITKMTQGDWGKSIIYRRPVKETIFERFPMTLKLASGAALDAFQDGMPALSHSGKNAVGIEVRVVEPNPDRVRG